ncbi:flagellar hook-basal body complex protein FliE [Hafnia alvei]|jgi:flagellar hook-basal body complex protein FliE|uniref:Flagellar hook-basal body complex protein FliE n=2 Tax=Hafnia alvei TaxID=569 RepID=A0A097QWZ6_HAFAL|nr:MULTISPECIES: flagellar hook-basal body complex protein FliE [Hafnia]MDN6833731.1 flagellar hook-basal body complex protein FliE [Enterobacterales bacterium]NEY26542.1 flagellar hook-basal body complex protein FliE [Escherichia coli]AIU70983.1 flagellar hook-basal body protein FliE [Hafnia alvei FB1]ANC40175.1 flagellar hook-basal body protein FliE [Hafnia alvei]AWV46709.1 flagellar hook-basal body complex protein FliE [Hafnia alvei]
MDKIEGLGMPASQMQMMQRMQQTAAAASAGIAPNMAIAPANTSLFSSAPQSVSFGQVMNNAINHVDQMQHVASAKQTAIDTGQSDDLTGAMLESQKASVAFSAMVQVRNKLTTALDEVMNIAL